MFHQEHRSEADSTSTAPTCIDLNKGSRTEDWQMSALILLVQARCGLERSADWHKAEWAESSCH